MALKKERRRGDDVPRELLYLRFMVRAGEILGLSMDYRETLQNVCGVAVETVADICLLDLGKPGNIELVACAHRQPGHISELRQAGNFLVIAQDRPPHPVCEVIDTGKAVVVQHVDEEYIERHSTTSGHAQFMRRMGYRSMIVVPVVSHVEGILGGLTFVRTKDSDEEYDESALLFALDLGRRCGAAIVKAKLYSKTLEIAHQFQRVALPPSLPTVEGVTLDAYYEPAESAMLIGGDWYDAFELADGRLALSIGDVAGHGLDAAAFMGSLRTALRTALYTEPDLMRALNVADYLIMREFPDERHATAMIALYDPGASTLTCAAAGHPGPLIWDEHAAKVTDPFKNRGLPIGLRTVGDSIPDQEVTVSLHPGSFVVFFTDGLLEWQRDYLAGEEHLEKAIEQSDIRLAAHPARAIRDAAVRGTHEDDIAVLTLRVSRGPKETSIT